MSLWRLPIAVLIAAALALGAFFVAFQQNRDRGLDNRLLFSFSCSLSLAVAERLDGLVGAALLNPTHPPETRRKFNQYRRDFQRGKDFCPKLDRDEKKRMLDLVNELGGMAPAVPSP